MDLVLTEEQTMLQKSARDFVTSRAPRSRLRKLAEEKQIWSRELYKEMAALGWLGLMIPEAHGGAGLGARYLMVVLEELGKALAPEPVLSSALVAALAIGAGDDDTQAREHLPAIATGERVYALAHAESGGRYGVGAVDTSADKAAGGWSLRGEKVHVEEGSIADWLLVSARAPDGISLFVVPASAKGVRVRPQARIDGRSAAIIELDGVIVERDARLGEPHKGQRLLERVLDAATIGLSAEMLGTMLGAFEMTLDYLKTREQFGVPIGSFQALQHRAARIFVETELARSAVMHAHGVLDGLDEGASAAVAASVAKAKCSDALMLIAHESVQMHGGIGMTTEHDVGMYLKRARVAEMTLGDATYHRDRYARLGGF